jgi:small subunit ribosomal protein S4
LSFSQVVTFLKGTDMARERRSKHKLSRRAGKDLFGTGGESLQRRINQPPGMHGKKPRRRESEYSKQLREKQKVKQMYGLHEGQFLRFFKRAQKTRGITGLTLLRLLERRLDNVVYRLGFARTRPQARQFVSHGLIRVDGKRVNIPSYLLNPGQQVELKGSAMEIPDVKDLIENEPPVPGWLEKKDGVGHVLREPERHEMDQDISEQMIVEFYSR